MDTQPQRQPSNKQVIRFSNGNRAQVVLSPIDARVTDLLHVLSLPQPGALIVIAGGASQMDKRVSEELAPLFTGGIAHVAASLDALIIDGGTQTGVMALIGQGVAQQQNKPALLGVVPAGIVTYPGKSTEKTSSEAVPLDPNHSHFVLVETDEWGGETETMYELVQVFSQNSPSIAILINGGGIAKREVLHNVRQRRPIIIIEGSGRFADDIAGMVHNKSISPAEPELAEIITDGDLYLFPLTTSAAELEQLIQRLLNKQ
jgi:hypothetical protein